jgi:hypothetical protein
VQFGWDPDPQMPAGYTHGEAWWTQHGLVNALGMGAIAVGDVHAMKRELDTKLSPATPQLVLAPVCAEVAAHAIGIARDVRELAIELVDYPQAARVIEAIAKHRLPSLVRLAFGHHDFAGLMSRGAVIDTAHDHGPFVASELVDRFAAATPALRELCITGARLLAGLAHPALERLELHGFPVDGAGTGEYDGEVALPRLARLVSVAYLDDYRHTPLADLALDRARYPALRELVYRGQYDEGHAGHGLYAMLAECELLPQLVSLELPYLDNRYDRIEEGAERFRHLARFLVGELRDDGGDELDDLGDDEPMPRPSFAERVRAALPNVQVP